MTELTRKTTPPMLFLWGKFSAFFVSMFETQLFRKILSILNNDEFSK
jgi:hypothetical protein